MKRRSSSLLIMLGLLPALAASQSGCQGKSPTSDPILIELSEPEAVIVEKEVLREDQGELHKMRIRVLRWKVKYRFVKGEPDPDARYACSVNIDGWRSIDAFGTPGKDLHAQGLFTTDFALDRRINPRYTGPESPKSIKFIACRNEHQISVEVSCPVKE